MRLRQLSLTGFRSCVDLSVDFESDITVFVGENGSGKSNIIDAIRLALSPASGRRSIYFDAERDLSFGLQPGSTVAVKCRYTDLTRLESSLYLPQIVDKHGDLVYTITYSTDPSLPKRLSTNRSVGDAAIADPEPENREKIACVYLPPLRDAIRTLDSPEGTRLAEVMRSLGSRDDISEFEITANEKLREFASQPLATQALSAIQEHLVEMTRPAREQVTAIGYRDQSLNRLARSLYMQLAEVGTTPRDLSSSGLGYANLLFIATVVIELEKAKEFDLTLLLVEEPEAHLHPQLQSVLLAYLGNRANMSGHGSEHQSPTGRIQVIVSTHSPNLASAVSTAKIVVVTKAQSTSRGPKIPDFPATQTQSLSQRPLTDYERRKVDRYLNVTRAALLFARQIILVEGIAESLLVRVLAEKCVLTGDQQAVEREQFQAISILAIDGVDFAPYLKLLLDGDSPTSEKIVVVTDADPTKEGRRLGIDRKNKYEDKYSKAIADGVLSVHVGLATLEADLMAIQENGDLLKECYLQLHPRSSDGWDAVWNAAPATHEERAGYFLAKIKSGELKLEKGDFAHAVADTLGVPEKARSFVVPGYLRDAVMNALIPTGTGNHATEGA